MEHDPNSCRPPAAYHAIRAELGLSDDALAGGYGCRLTNRKASFTDPRLAGNRRRFSRAHLLSPEMAHCKRNFRQEIETLNLAERAACSFGWRDDVPHVDGAIDIFLMPSLWEGFGMVLLEAMHSRFRSSAKPR